MCDCHGVSLLGVAIYCEGSIGGGDGDIGKMC